uniref:Putative short from d7 salivary protein n=2 Tax=Nematocera TaxID=7148 RepID=T1DHU0_ANOAQ
MMWKSTVLIALVIALVQVTGQSLEKCKSVFSDSAKTQFCRARKYEMIRGVDMDKTLDCVLKAVNVVDKMGYGKYHDLYQPMNNIEQHRKHDYNLEICIGKSFRLEPKVKCANAFYKCMMDTDSKETFKKVVNARVCN